MTRIITRKTLISWRAFLAFIEGEEQAGQATHALDEETGDGSRGTGWAGLSPAPCPLSLRLRVGDGKRRRRRNDRVGRLRARRLLVADQAHLGEEIRHLHAGQRLEE